MPKHANEPLPRFALFITERAAQIAQHYEVMRQPSLSEGSATQPPAPGTAGKSQLHRVRGLAFQASAQPQFWRGKPQQALFRATQQTFAGAIDQPQLRVVVERKDGEVNLLHHRSQQGIGLHCPQALLPKYLTESIDFNDHFAHGIVASPATGAQRKVFFSQRGQKIRKRLQRKNDAIPQRESEAEPESKDEKGKRPNGS